MLPPIVVSPVISPVRSPVTLPLNKAAVCVEPSCVDVVKIFSVPLLSDFWPIILPVTSPVNVPSIVPVPVIVGDFIVGDSNVLFFKVWLDVNWTMSLLLIDAILVAVAAFPVVFWLPSRSTPGKVICPLPSKTTPPILTELTNLVAETAFPVTLPVILPVILPETSKLPAIPVFPFIYIIYSGWGVICPIPNFPLIVVSPEISKSPVIPVLPFIFKVYSGWSVDCPIPNFPLIVVSPETSNSPDNLVSPTTSK